MSTLAIGLIVLVTALHGAFLILEMFLWSRPLGRRVFRQSREAVAQTKALAANQGLYNGFLAAGLLWSVLSQRGDVAWFFLVCVAVAGVFGALTVNRRIFIIQAVPALVAIVAVWQS